jgi:LuxR family quorum-sensing system transcriptional regulator SolR
MKRWQTEQLHLIRSSAGSESLFLVLLQEVERLGFQYYSFGMRSRLSIAKPNAIWRSNYPPEWQERYESRGYVRVDPTVVMMATTDNPIVWTDELFANAPQLRAEARAFGLVHGLAQPRRDVKDVVSLLTCVRGDPAITEEEVREKSERLRWLSLLSHETMLLDWASSLRTEQTAELSGRELEVLRWSCDGKTSADIAQIIGVTDATVKFHIRNACLKLGTPNKTAAAVRAVLLGLF